MAHGASGGTAGNLPNLVIIGAAKTGTTSLHRYLDLHPEIFMARAKELKLFDHDDWRERLGWYRKQFPTDLPVRGESSPTYTHAPMRGSVPERMHEIIPDARLIYLVRDPIERLIAQYVEYVHVTYERRSFAEAMADYDAPSNIYAMASRYAYQIDRYREFFPDERILVIDHRDLLESRVQTLAEVFAFLGINSEFVTAEFDTLHNVREQKIWLNRPAVWLNDHGMLHPLRVRSRRLPSGLLRQVKRLSTRPVVVPALDDALRVKLQRYLGDDARRLREYTGLSFAHWSV